MFIDMNYNFCSFNAGGKAKDRREELENVKIQCEALVCRCIDHISYCKESGK